METRKLQQVGGGTYTVSIPKAWADDHGLEVGMELHLYTYGDGSLVVRDSETDGGDLGTAAVAVAGDDPAAVERAVRSAHAAGFATVTLVPAGVDGDQTGVTERIDAPGAGGDREDATGQSDGAAGEFTDDQRRAARRTAGALVGTDLLVDDAEEITVGHLLDADNVSVRQSVVQLEFTALAVHEGATAALLEGDPDAVDRLGGRRDEADRLAQMVTRHFARSLVSFDEVDCLGVSRPELFDYYVTAHAIERVADQGLALARVAADLEEGLPEPVASGVRDAAGRARGVVEDATAAMLDGDVGTAHAALDDRDEVAATADAVERELYDSAARPAVAAGTVRALDAVVETADCGASVATTALRAATRDDNTADRTAGPATGAGESTPTG